MTHHPMRDAVIHVWEAEYPMENQPAYIARLHPYNIYPVFATGDSRGEAASKLEALRTEAVEKYEAAYIARQSALKIARAKKAAKEASK